MSQPASTSPSPLEQATVAKILRRLIPLIVILYIFNYMDRVNVSFAKSRMSTDLNLWDQAYGLGAGIFYISYFLFEVPSNLIMQRVGARLWLARIMITWGLISSSMMFIRGPVSFAVLRFLLGAAEAGFAPGILLYLTYWLPLRAQARAVAWFLTSIALAGVIGSPVAGLVLKLDGTALLGFPLAGWRWLFLLEGIPSVLGGVAVFWLLTDRPQQAKWLSDGEKAWLADRLEREHADRGATGHVSLLAGLTNKRVLLLCAVYCLIMFAFQGLLYWMPSIIRQATGVEDDLQVSLLTMLPYSTAAVTMVLVGRHSDRTGERRWHLATCCAAGGIALAACALAPWPVAMLIALCAAAGAVFATLGPFWSIPPLFLTGTAAAAGIALINSGGNLVGGFLGPYLMGVAKQHTKTYHVSVWLTAGAIALAAALVATVRVSGPLSRARSGPLSRTPRGNG